MKKIALFISFIFLFLTFSNAAVSESYDESLWNSFSKKEKVHKVKQPKDSIRRGWTFGILPSVAYDADKGFQGGVLSNIYYFGDGSTYPEYLHSFYVELAYTTKHCGIFRFNYDSKYLIPKHRLTVDISYLPDAICDFYGFNGYQTVLNKEWINNKKYPQNCTIKYLFLFAYKIRNIIVGCLFI